MIGLTASFWTSYSLMTTALLVSTLKFLMSCLRLPDPSALASPLLAFRHSRAAPGSGGAPLGTMVFTALSCKSSGESVWLRMDTHW